MTEKRRRGAELEQAIFDATTSLLDEVGYENLTFQKVADRAGTSKPVLYRRWSSTFELALAALREPVVKVTGKFTDFQFSGDTFEEDLLQLMIRFRDLFYDFGNKYLQLLFTEITHNPDRNSFLSLAAEGDLEMMNRLFERARKRGDHIRLDLSDQAKLVPFTQVRYTGMIRGHIMDDAELKQLVDEVLLPIYKAE